MHTQKTARLWRQFAALSYDFFLLLALALLTTLTYLSVRQFFTDMPPNQKSLEWQLQPLLVCTWAGFYLFFWHKKGQTLGMQTWQIQLQTQQGTPLTYRHCVIRCISATLSWGTLGLGYLWAFIDTQGLTWHDRLSRTQVTLKLPKS